jgi:tRNA-Thr(GGU) m(6)t(6)A37 methyltransferase TsaA
MTLRERVYTRATESTPLDSNAERSTARARIAPDRCSSWRPSMTIDPIGVVHNAIHDPVDEGWGAVSYEVRLEPRFEGSLAGLEAFSHAVVVYWMHKASFDPSEHLVRRPRDRSDMPLLGIFAQRARHRPNPLGVSAVPIEGVKGRSLFVRGLDAMDGTPVLDIKPHVPFFDAPKDPHVPDWMYRLLDGYR